MPATTTQDPIFRLLDHLVNEREMDLYYYLMNEASILSCTTSLLELSNQSGNKQYNIRLESILRNIFDEKAKVITVETESQDSSLKATLSDKFKKSSAWQFLHQQFPEARVEDILHKNWK